MYKQGLKLHKHEVSWPLFFWFCRCIVVGPLVRFRSIQEGNNDSIAAFALLNLCEKVGASTLPCLWDLASGRRFLCWRQRRDFPAAVTGEEADNLSVGYMRPGGGSVLLAIAAQHVLLLLGNGSRKDGT